MSEQNTTPQQAETPAAPQQPITPQQPAPKDVGSWTPPAADVSSEGITVTDGARPKEPVKEAPAGDQPAAEADDGEQKGELPEWMRKRLARERRKRDDERLRADAYEAKLGEAQELIDKLKAQRGKPKAEDFEKYDDYLAAKKEAEKPVAAPEVEPPSEYTEVLLDLVEACDVADEDLWPQLQELADQDKFYLSPRMAMHIADLDDPVAALRALAAAGDEFAGEMPGLSERQRVRRLREVLKEAEAKTEKPRDPGTGQFVKKQSAAPDPISPVGGGSAGPAPLEALSVSEFIERRNAETKSTRFGW